MADIDFDEYGGGPRDSGLGIAGARARQGMNLLGAVCSVALLAGVGIWGYRLAVRDVTGVPLVNAAKGGNPVAPSNPGGAIAEHQGMAVNAVPELRSSEALPDQIILAPAPVVLAEEDSPGLIPMAPETMAEAVSAPAPQPLEAVAIAAAAPVVDGAAPEVDGDAGLDPVALALAEALSAGAEPVTALEPVTEEAGEMLAALPADPDAPPAIRPRPRPDRGGLAAIQPVAAVATPSLDEVDPATLAVGTRLVQLGAFDTADLARGEWAKLRGRFGDLMSGKSAVVQSAVSGGRTFYRLRAHGFDGEDDARRFCAALLAEDAACIPVAHR